MGRPESRDHFVAAVTMRELLQPYVGRPEQATAAKAAAWRRAQPRPTQPQRSTADLSARGRRMPRP